MVISENTRISALIKENKDSIEAIASISKPLEKLRNPILRKLMASRVTIAEAAKVGGCTITDFEKVLTPLGFKFVITNLVELSEEDKAPNWLKNLSEDRIFVFDVRAMLSNGQDPLKQILKRFKEMPAGNALCIVNTFIPIPLVRLLEKEKVQSFTKTVHANECHTFFYTIPDSEINSEPTPKKPGSVAIERVRMLDRDSFRELRDQFPTEKTQVLNVRHLEMPGPMQAILEALGELGNDEALYVNHKRVPLYLLEEIADENYCVNILNLSETDVKLLIHKIEQ